MKEELIDIVKDASFAQKVVQTNSVNPLISRIGVDATHKRIARYDGKCFSRLDYLGIYYLTYYAACQQSLVDTNNRKEVILYRNAPLAAELQQTDIGENYEQKIKGTGNQAACFLINSGHIIDLLDYDKKSILIEGDRERQYDDLEQFLQKLKDTQAERDANIKRQRELEEERKRAEEENRAAQEKKRLTEEINKLRREEQILEGQINDMVNLTKYIHKQAQLKFHPVVDPVQSRIKFNNIYNGKVVVISGGPGTGKTTTMIARLKYLTDEKAINADALLDPEDRKYKLSASQRNELFKRIEENKDWMFFSPSELLRQYLAKAMEDEGLNLPTSKTQSWEEFLGKMMKEYEFFSVNMDDNSPFKKGRNQGIQLIYQNSHAIEKLQDFYLKRFVGIPAKLPKLDNIKFNWLPTAKYIVDKLALLTGENIDQTIQILSTISNTVGDECQSLVAELKSKANDLSEWVYAKVRNNEIAWNQILELIKAEEKAIQNDDLEIISDDEISEEKIDEKLLSDNQKGARLIRSWIEPYARSLVDKSKNLTERQTKIADIVLPLLEEDDKNRFTRISELALFKVYAKYTRGAKTIMMTNVNSIYKSFRKSILNNNDEGWNLSLLKETIGQENVRLHIQEQALLLGFVNNLVRALQSRNNGPINGKYFDQYNLYARPIIGIDEATDFSEVEIYSMMSFAYQGFSSITIAGDIMQRMTTKGLRSWSDLDNVVPNKSVEQLNKSYRQSKNMLAVAQQLYLDTVGEMPNYVPHLRESRVPKALACIETNEDDKIAWIEKRIAEVFLAYGKQLPSIAIFLNDKDDVQRFAKKLEDKDFFYDNAIPVIDGSAGQTLGNKNQVRVFPIDTVKGMEFDVVFFHNIDETNLPEELVKKYLYVGVSRASFFLGATFANPTSNILKYFTTGEDWSKI